MAETASGFEDLIDMMRQEPPDIDGLMNADPVRMEALRMSDQLKGVPHGNALVVQAQFWGYMQRNAANGNRPFSLPQVVRDNLTWVPPATTLDYAPSSNV